MNRVRRTRDSASGPFANDRLIRRSHEGSLLVVAVRAADPLGAIADVEDTAAPGVAAHALHVFVTSRRGACGGVEHEGSHSLQMIETVILQWLDGCRPHVTHGEEHSCSQPVMRAAP